MNDVAPSAHMGFMDNLSGLIAYEYRGLPVEDMGWVPLSPANAKLFLDRGQPVQRRPLLLWQPYTGMSDLEPGAAEPSALERMVNLIDELHEGRHRLTPAQIRANIILLQHEAARIANQERKNPSITPP